MEAERVTVLDNFMANTYSIPESAPGGLKAGLATLTVCYGPRTGCPCQEPDRLNVSFSIFPVTNTKGLIPMSSILALNFCTFMDPGFYYVARSSLKNIV